MILTYTPDDGEPQVWQFKADEMLNAESELIERRTDWTWLEFLDKLQKGATLARRALLWTMLRRVHPTLRFEDVSFKQGQLRLDFDRQELQNILDALAGAPDVPGVNKDLMRAAVESELAKAPAGPGKAPERSNGISTSMPSLSSGLIPSPPDSSPLPNWTS